MKSSTVDSIENEICLFVQIEILDQSVSFNASMTFKNLGVDSLDLIQIILFIERSFGIKIETEDLVPQNLESVKTLAVFTFNKLENG